MFMETPPFILHGTLDSEVVDSIRSKIKDSDWDVFVERQKKSFTHRLTKTIPIIFDKTFNFQHLNAHYTENYDLFKSEISTIDDEIKKNVGVEGYIMRAILVLLPKNSKIPPHVDIVGKSLEIGRRCHIAIQTNENCFFTVGNETKNLKCGEIWEIDNCGREHSVSNLGDTDRIHLIVDWVSNDDLENFKKNGG